MYHHYKPLRNLLRRYAIRPCLVQLWHIFQHVRNGAPSPYLNRSLRERAQPWELCVLARELVLNASDEGGTTFDRFDDFAKAINAVKQVGEAISKDVINPETVMDEMAAIAHQQSPWFQSAAYTSLLRYWRLLSAPAVAPIVERVLGVDVQTVFQIGMVGGGELLRSPFIDMQRNLSSVSISADEVARFYAPITTNLDALRERLREQARYDRNWVYTWNPLEATPLLRLDPAHQQVLVAPVPELHLRAFAHGVYYQLVNDPEFGNAFGGAFETYVGDVLHYIFPGPAYRVMEERPYVVKGQQKHGTDWIISDDTAHVFIECKTKRVRLEAKMAGDVAAVESALDAMAKFVVQLYKNIRDAQQGVTAWRPDTRPVYPLVLTLEDWHLFAPWMVSRLDALVGAGLVRAGIPAVVMREMPYTIASIEDFTGGALTASAVGLEVFFARKTTPAHSKWMLKPFAAQAFAEVAERVYEIPFMEDLREILPFEGVVELPARG